MSLKWSAGVVLVVAAGSACVGSDAAMPPAQTEAPTAGSGGGTAPTTNSSAQQASSPAVGAEAPSSGAPAPANPTGQTNPSPETGATGDRDTRPSATGSDDRGPDTETGRPETGAGGPPETSMSEPPEAPAQADPTAEAEPSGEAEPPSPGAGSAPSTSDPLAELAEFLEPGDRTPNPNNPPECPAVAPDNPLGPCVGLPVYLECDYTTYYCICDWVHWLCI
ncbi:MAG: hypothetical protein OXU20_40350 [Myxococcales bacterium]|nr:hypothetical protein [Myxococcales bacterium]